MRIFVTILLSIAHSALGRYSANTGNFCDCHETCTGADLVWACGTDERDIWKNPCFSDVYSTLPFCNESLDINARVQDLLNRIPISEKLGGAGM